MICYFVLTLGTAYAGASGKSIGSTAASANALYIKKKKKSLKSFLQVPKAISNNLYNMQKFKFPNLCKIFKFVCAFSEEAIR